ERDVSQGSACERSRDDAREERRLDENEYRGRGAEASVEAEQVAYRPRPANETLIQDVQRQRAGEPRVDASASVRGCTFSPMTRAALRTRSKRSPVVRSVRKVAPWKANRSTNAIPASTV